jgi:hypothetical protein
MLQISMRIIRNILIYQVKRKLRCTKIFVESTLTVAKYKISLVPLQILCQTVNTN